MRKQRWLIVFFGLATICCLAEIAVGIFHEAVFGLLWIYYNGFYTSFESFFYFGALGSLGFKGFLMLLKRMGYRIISEEEYEDLSEDVDFYVSEMELSIHAPMG
jgi:hypothetical protein